MTEKLVLGIWTGWLLGGCLLSSSVYGDEVLLENGEVLKGTLVRVEQGTVTFDSDYMATVTLALEHVQRLTTDNPVTLCLKGGNVVTSKLVEADSGLGRFDTPDGSICLQTWSDVVAINPDPSTLSEKEAVTPEAESLQAPPWTGSMDAGLTSTRGNTQTQRYTGNISLNRKSDKLKTTFTSDYARTAQKERERDNESITEDWWKAYSKLSYFFTSKNYSYVDGRYERDSVAHLQRRVAIGMGAGYQLVQSEQLNMSVDMGGASLRETYESQSDNNSELSLQMGYDFDLKINDHLLVRHELTCYPNGRKFSDYYLTSTAEIKRTLNDKIFANIKAIFNYDALPAVDSVSTDIKTIFGVGINF